MPRTDTAVAIDFLNSNRHQAVEQDGSNGKPRPSKNGKARKTTAGLWPSLAWGDDAPKRLRRLNSKSKQSEAADAIARSLRPNDRGRLKELSNGELPFPLHLIDLGEDATGPQTSDFERCAKLLRSGPPRWKRSPSTKLSRLAVATVEPLLDTQSPPDVVRAAWSLLATASRLDDASLVTLWSKLLQASRCMIHEIGHVDDPDRAQAPATCTENLQAAEALVVIGLFFRHVIGAAELARRGGEWADRLLEGATDNDGTPHADWWPTLSAGVMSALRIVWLDAWWGEGRLLSKRFRRRLRRLLKRVVALNELRPHRDVAMWGLRQLETRSKRRAGEDLFGGKSASHSGWANLGILRSRWNDTADMCAVGHSGDACRVKTDVGGQALLHGIWTIEVSVDGAPVAFAPEWSLNCWNSDSDGDYLELGRDASGVNLIRQVYLSRTDSFLYLSDSIRADSGAISYRSTLPMPAGWQIDHDGLTRELAISQSKRQVRVFPINLPQQVAEGTNGRVEIVDQQLRLFEESPQPGLSAAVLFEWSSSRRKSSVDWSVLTIAEEGKRLDAAEASGARIRIGDKQLIFFHSISKAKMPRTVMGHHTPYESVIAKFEDGNFVPLLNVEAGQGESE